MPGGGFAVLEQTRAQGLGVPVIFVTGSSSPEWKARAEADGAFDYLVKPVGKEQILNVLGRALERARITGDTRPPAEMLGHSPTMRTAARG